MSLQISIFCYYLVPYHYIKFKLDHCFCKVLCIIMIFEFSCSLANSDPGRFLVFALSDAYHTLEDYDITLTTLKTPMSDFSHLKTKDKKKDL